MTFLILNDSRMKIEKYINNDFGNHDIVVSDGVASETIYGLYGESKYHVYIRALQWIERWNML